MTDTTPSALRSASRAAPDRLVDAGPSGHAPPGRRRTAGALALAGATAALLLVPAGGALAGTGAPRDFASRPDLRPPGVKVLTRTSAFGPGYVFVGPKGTPHGAQDGNMIFDREGRLVYWDAEPRGEAMTNFRTQTYQGKPVLTWWQGAAQRGFGYGEGVIMDQNYDVIAKVQAGDNLKADLHEFRITDRGTALIDTYRRVPRDLRSVGGSKYGRAQENTVQEVDIATGKLLFEWRNLDHVPLSDSYQPVPERKEIPYDYFHVNSVDLDTDGNFIISARATHTVYKVDRKTGNIIWRLGGKHPTFHQGKGTRTRWQHDAQRQADGTITVFDNNARLPSKRRRSYGKVLKVDEAAKAVSLVASYTHRGRQLSPSQGNIQKQANGNYFVGWGGTNDDVTEFTPAGDVAFEARFSSRGADSYRAYHDQWVGHPRVPPKVVAKRSGHGTAVRTSWNGATEVASWRVLGGPDDGHLGAVAQRTKTGFETYVRVGSHQPKVAVQALDAAGKVIGQSRTITPGKDY